MRNVKNCIFSGPSDFCRAQKQTQSNRDGNDFALISAVAAFLCVCHRVLLEKRDLGSDEDSPSRGDEGNAFSLLKKKRKFLYCIPRLLWFHTKTFFFSDCSLFSPLGQAQVDVIHGQRLTYFGLLLSILRRRPFFSALPKVKKGVHSALGGCMQSINVYIHNKAILLLSIFIFW